jgi:transposase
MEKKCHSIGIDISKETFDVSFYNGVSHHHEQYANTKAGFASFESAVSPESCCVMEATGVYHLHLAVYLYERGIAVSVVNPLVIRRFTQMQLRRAKTDKADAQQIALYGWTNEPPLWQPDPKAVTQMGQLYALIEGITVYRTSLKNQREAFSRQPHGDPKLLKKLDSEITRQKNMSNDYLQQLIHLAKTTYGEAFESVVSIPGIGQKTASLLVMVTNGFTRFDSSKQLIAYLGMSPRQYQSGSSVHGRAHICKMGMHQMRSTLYVCAWTAARHNQACKELFLRLVQKGKPGKLAMVAVANKLIKQAFAIATNHTSYEQNFQRS